MKIRKFLLHYLPLFGGFGTRFFWDLLKEVLFITVETLIVIVVILQKSKIPKWFGNDWKVSILGQLNFC